MRAASGRLLSLGKARRGCASTRRGTDAMVLSASKNNNFIRAGQEASARCNACHSISKEMAMVAPPRPHSSRANDWTMGQRSMSCVMRIVDITATISIMCILTHHRQGRGLIGAKGQRHCDDAIRLDHRDELADLPAVQWQRRHHQPVRLRHRRPKGKSLAGMQISRPSGATASTSAGCSGARASCGRNGCGCCGERQKC